MSLPENAQQWYEGLTAGGLSANAAAGIVGNIAQESGGSPTAQEAGGSGYGGIQWTPGSAAKYGTTVAQQIPEIFAYIASNGSVADINAHASSPAAAALYFSSKYERPLASAANNPYRMQVAAEVARAAQTGKWAGNKSPGVKPSSPASASSAGYGGTRPGGQPSSDSSNDDNGQGVTDLFANYEAEVNTPRTAPQSTFSGTGWTAPFQWFWQSWSGTYAQDTGDTSA